MREEPTFADFADLDERRWAAVVGYHDRPIELLVGTFSARRAELVSMLRRLDPADWARTGAHERHGRLTLLQIASHLADHEIEHLAQIRAALDPRDHVTAR